MSSKINCHFKNIIKPVYLYEKFDTFIYHIKKKFQIDNETNLQFYIYFDSQVKIYITDQKVYNDYFIKENYVNDIYFEMNKEVKKITIKDKREMNNNRGKTENNIIKDRKNIIDLGKRYNNDNSKELRKNNYLKEIR